MIQIDNIVVLNFDGAIRGMRNPMNSWGNSDSGYCEEFDCNECPVCPEHPERCQKVEDVRWQYIVGPADLELMRKLYKAGPEHAKYLRQILVSFDINAPLYWWKEMDTYKVGTTANSCSTMHKLASRDLTIEDFSHEHLEVGARFALRQMISIINEARDIYVKTGEKWAWWQMIQLLPSSYNQYRTLTMNYANIANMIKQREHHKLDEWRDFCDKMLSDCPFLKEIMGR